MKMTKFTNFNDITKIKFSDTSESYQSSIQHNAL